MDAIFGKKRPEELFSPLNGLLISKRLVRHFDAGKFVIVPDIPEIVRENTLVFTVKRWLHHKPQEYRVSIVDPDWEVSEERISRRISLTFGQPDGSKLVFLSSFRPAARYLYFRYYVQVLRMCWLHSSQGKSSQVSAVQAWKGSLFWGRAGRYLPRNTILVLIKEMGREYQFVLKEAAGSRPDDDKLLLGRLVKSATARPWNLVPDGFHNNVSKDEVSDELEYGDDG
ncbi:hypothetical protein N7517_006618 [Penicillium concentricum]|uniref:HNH nuclease domain-containing protein n=1 Tax=Penicillium concentricum TaxID=293559 RepID=A0A9W9SAK9_9EURO|nr:uncharacterized protein N7517_006618 [Penicillium concentricum]KAJ5374612.1 hypothetical protein N7517_006618 [Penicillium concentricum]